MYMQQISETRRVQQRIDWSGTSKRHTMWRHFVSLLGPAKSNKLIVDAEDERSVSITCDASALLQSLPVESVRQAMQVAVWHPHVVRFHTGLAWGLVLEGLLTQEAASLLRAGISSNGLLRCWQQWIRVDLPKVLRQQLCVCPWHGAGEEGRSEQWRKVVQGLCHPRDPMVLQLVLNILPAWEAAAGHPNTTIANRTLMQCCAGTHPDRSLSIEGVILPVDAVCYEELRACDLWLRHALLSREVEQASTWPHLALLLGDLPYRRNPSRRRNREDVQQKTVQEWLQQVSLRGEGSHNSEELETNVIPHLLSVGVHLLLMEGCVLEERWLHLLHQAGIFCVQGLGVSQIRRLADALQVRPVTDVALLTPVDAGSQGRATVAPIQQVPLQDAASTGAACSGETEWLPLYWRGGFQDVGHSLLLVEPHLRSSDGSVVVHDEPNAESTRDSQLYGVIPVSGCRFFSFLLCGRSGGLLDRPFWSLSKLLKRMYWAVKDGGVLPGSGMCESALAKHLDGEAHRLELEYSSQPDKSSSLEEIECMKGLSMVFRNLASCLGEEEWEQLGVPPWEGEGPWDSVSPRIFAMERALGGRMLLVWFFHAPSVLCFLCSRFRLSPSLW